MGRRNRLAAESSPYLRQHAGNPVDWYPWGDEAFARARAEDKPVFLSVGYSACHWCHVMERESFSQPDLAELLNQHFVSIKVDREERPDLDELYLLATQVLTGRGGWPNSVWLTTDGRPWFAGTYFPPENRPGQPGFKSVLRLLAKTWAGRRPEIEEQAAKLAAFLSRASDQRPAAGRDRAAAPPAVETALGQLLSGFDRERGGLGGAPKFPPHQALALVFAAGRAGRGEDLLPLAVRTLEAMARGGVRDHLGGGFHRYATDERWLLPHFEKMLYDNAQLLEAYAAGFRATGREEFRQAARETGDWLLREMADPAGGFYASLDADSQEEEGRFYLWTAAEIDAVLGPADGEFFRRAYGAAAAGNFRPETGGPANGLNILHRPAAIAAGEEARLAPLRERLLARRAKRARPHRDEKVLADWNGLAVAGLAALGALGPGEERFLAAARKAADFILAEMRPAGRLQHVWQAGTARQPGFLDDYAFLAYGLLTLHGAGGEERWLAAARELADELLERFSDRQTGGFYFVAADQEALWLRRRDPFDRAVPSGNGLAALVLARLARLTGEERYRAAARETLAGFAPVLLESPLAAATLVRARLELDT